MTPHIPEITTAGAAANTVPNKTEADTTAHIAVDGFDSLVPEIIDLDAPR
ncbi:MAG TPA: ribonuclease D, partial [Arthrobacter sp.]|nr:ribonuclease D [Arthrobacter sp.]